MKNDDEKNKKKSSFFLASNRHLCFFSLFLSLVYEFFKLEIKQQQEKHNYYNFKNFLLIKFTYFVF